MYREALAIRKKFYGDEHPDVAISLSNLAELLKDQVSLVANTFLRIVQLTVVSLCFFVSSILARIRTPVFQLSDPFF